jgi:hypothetical protein
MKTTTVLSRPLILAAAIALASASWLNPASAADASDFFTKLVYDGL